MQSAPRENAIIIGAEYGTWTVKKSLGHSRFACVCKKCGAKKTIFSGSLRGGDIEHLCNIEPPTD